MLTDVIVLVALLYSEKKIHIFHLAVINLLLILRANEQRLGRDYGAR